MATHKDAGDSSTALHVLGSSMRRISLEGCLKPPAGVTGPSTFLRKLRGPREEQAASPERDAPEGGAGRPGSQACGNVTATRRAGGWGPQALEHRDMHPGRPAEEMGGPGKGQTPHICVQVQ